MGGGRLNGWVCVCVSVEFGGRGGGGGSAGNARLLFTVNTSYKGTPREITTTRPSHIPLSFSRRPSFSLSHVARMKSLARVKLYGCDLNTFSL